MSSFMRTASTAIAAIGLAACAKAPVDRTEPAAAPSPLPDAVQVVCDANGTSVTTPIARPQPDGVHLRIENTTGTDMGFDVGTLGGDNAPSGASEIVWPVPPGDIEVGCSDLEGNRQDRATLTIQDPDGIWIDPKVGCDDVAVGTADYVQGATGEHGDLVAIARAGVADRLREGDVVEAAGYPAATDRHVIVVRDGTTVADLTYRLDEAGTGWLLDSESTCDGFSG